MSEDEGRRNIDNYVDKIVETHAIVGRLETSIISHVEQDRDDFSKVNQRIDETHNRINGISKLVWVGLGVVMALEFVLMFFKK